MHGVSQGSRRALFCAECSSLHLCTFPQTAQRVRSSLYAGTDSRRQGIRPPSLYFSLLKAILCNVPLIKTRMFEFVRNQIKWHRWQRDCRDRCGKKKKSCKLHHNSLHFRLFRRLILWTISAPWFILTAKKEKRDPGLLLMFVLLQVFWMSDGRFSLGNSEKQQPCPPTAEAPVGPQKRTRKMSPHFEDFRGQEKKNMFNEAPRRFSEQREKNPFRLPPPTLGEEAGKENRQGGEATHARVQMCFARTEALRACSLRQLLAGYRKVSRCYLEEIKSILPNKLDIAAGGGATRRRRPPKFNSVHLR